MKRLRLDRWATQSQPPRNPRLQLRSRPFSHTVRPIASTRDLQQTCQHISRRGLATETTASDVTPAEDIELVAPIESGQKPTLKAPSHRRAPHSAKLSALHARLSLPSTMPLQTLARCLIDPSVDSRPGYNNAPFATLGQDLLGYYTSEHLICNYPRLPMPIIFAAQYAYVGSQTLAAMRKEWGVETVAAPGQEVDPGLLQLERVKPGKALDESGTMQLKDMPMAKRLGNKARRREELNERRGVGSRIVYDDEFGDLRSEPAVDTEPFAGAPISTAGESQDSSEDITTPVGTTVEAASASFVRALAGAIYLHGDASAVKAFHKDHILSRHLPLHTLFNFTHPTRDLSRLCLREGFEPPVARIISETGRLSRTPVFVVGVFSGNDKLGEGAGSSLNEARIRAAAAALRSWYLYSPPDTQIVVPSDVEGAVLKQGKVKQWKPQMVDMGEIVT
ncbi:54S ribosomal protein L3, mitochondrial [Acrodontium crateriforme]|uniref:Large ribosomal subunit protein mL44 n=1 Tax=Acrodontium crateriforme TaxID=150365 RepID=A0AAQ3LY05_9PEZI|nr:54S ribosomal protein L3, mitochondrial [Acrodontium crateriforme]